jgi:hypothetical protein
VNKEPVSTGSTFFKAKILLVKIFFTLIVLLFLCITLPAQPVPDSILKSGTPGPAPTIRLRSGKSAGYSEPLLVIDGIVYEFDELKKLDPYDIASIDILKKEKLGLVGCHSPLRDLMVITTKSAYVRKFSIKDFLTGENIPKATIYFTSGNDSIKAVANDSGILVTDKLKTGVKYDITVSSAGYKRFSTIVKGNKQEILLEKDVKTCGEVIVSSSVIRCGGCCRHSFSCRAKGTKIDTIPVDRIVSPGDKLSALIYPNPARRNNRFTIQLENAQNEIVQIAIISLNGSMVFRYSQQINKGLNRLSINADAKWAAGIYNIQIRNEKGTLVRQEKIVVQ